jgi:hypothetical protein
VKRRPHSVELARAEQEDRRAAASGIWPDYTAGWFAEFNALALQDIARRGLFDCYPDMGLAWQCDFWADLPWTDRERDQTIHLILADPRFPAIRATLLTEYGLDLEQELKAGLGGLEGGGA